jgi:YYY domain-containing protein
MVGNSLEIEIQFLFVLSWLAVLKFLQLSLWPALTRALPRYAYPVAYPASALLFTLISWYCGLLHLPVQLAILPFLALFSLFLYRRVYGTASLQANLRWDAIFLIFFMFTLGLRFVNPTISFAEKFMDHAFLASIMRTPIVPPLDPWFAGGTLDVYYYLGYWMMGVLGILSGVPSSVTFNLALPTVCALSAVILYAFGDLVLMRLRWIPLLALLLVNPSFVYQVLLGKTMQAILWDSTRTITNTINEYPLFSFIWGDVHPHVVGMFNQIFLIFLLVYAFMEWGQLEKRGQWALSLLAALSLGSMPLINTWDVLLYAPITLLFGFLIWRRYAGCPGVHPLAFLLATPLLSIIAYLPFYMQVQTQGIGGISLVPTPSDPLQFLLVHGLFLAVFILYLAGDMVKRPYLAIAALPFVIAGYPAAAIAAVPLAFLVARRDRTGPEVLAIAGLTLAVVVELIYFRDNMGETYYRMNTVFKCYVAIWLLLSTAALAMIGAWAQQLHSPPQLSRQSRRYIAIGAVAVLLVSPYLLNIDFGYSSRTLDGLEYLQNTHPGDAHAIAFLRSYPGADGIVEAEGGDYTYFSRISSFTGIPTIIGWPFHEYMWRVESGRVMERVADVQAIYEDPKRTAELMRRYNVTLLYVGDAERERYQVDIPLDTFDLIYDEQGVQIYHLLDRV